MNQSEEAYWKSVHAHIDALLDRPIEEHDAYLQEHCENAQMRRDVKSWLGYIYAPTQVLDASAVSYAHALLDDHQPPDRPPLWSKASGDRSKQNGKASDETPELPSGGAPDTWNAEATEVPPRRSRTSSFGRWAAVVVFGVVLYLLFWSR